MNTDDLIRALAADEGTAKGRWSAGGRIAAAALISLAAVVVLVAFAFGVRQTFRTLSSRQWASPSSFFPSHSQLPPASLSPVRSSQGASFVSQCNWHGPRARACNGRSLGHRSPDRRARRCAPRVRRLYP